MREMIFYPPEGPIREFRCTSCNWRFHVQHPVTEEVSLDLQASYAERWFGAHRCSQSSTVSRGEGHRFVPPLESALVSGGAQ
jgi:hypothetical protein